MTILDQDHQEFEINHSHNTGEIDTFLKNLRHYEGLQMYENEQLFSLPIQNKGANIDFKSSSFLTKENKKLIIKSL